MLKYENKTKLVEFESIEGAECDACHKAIEKEDFIEWQEMLSISFTGGYGSVFGDGSKMELDLCQECVKKHLGDFLRRYSE